MEAILFLDVSSITDWRSATKTRPIVAKHVTALTTDQRLLSQLLIGTLEGREPIDAHNVICVGEHGDAWQSTPKKLLAKYSISSIDQDGWLVCDPKPDNAVDCFEVTSDHIDGDQFYVVGLWGETLPDGTKNVQTGLRGDIVCRSQTDQSDIWIVRRKLFNSTYEIRG
jgi:hypothetical protein